MKYLVIKIAIFFMNVLYTFIKLLPVKKRVVFISRQSNSESEDISLLKRELKKKDKTLKVIVLCKKIEKGIKNKISYFFHILTQMYYLATSKVIILDGYCICASVLKKKKNILIIQMWHALGAFKKFGYSILDQEEGSSSKLAKVMKMHANYDYVLTSSEITRKYFGQAFKCDIDKIIPMPLPRVDRLTDKNYRDKIKEKIFKHYPNLKNKKNIIYVPTFRKGKEDISPINELIKKVDFSKYNLIIKMHPLSKVKITDNRVIVDKKFSSIDMMMVSNFVITDYSAIVFEAAILNKPIFFYCYDLEKYYKKRDFYIDYRNEMPGIISEEARDIISSIENKNYDLKRVSEFKNKYINFEKGRCTLKIAEFVLKNI